MKRSKRKFIACARTAQPIGIVFADIDHFKQLNDTYGHQFGDLVLQRVAKVADESTRRSDVFCRYGGEEFVDDGQQSYQKMVFGN